MTANAIEAVALSKRFRVPTERRTSLKERFVRGRSPEPKTFWALKDATFSVPKGSSLGLIGPNGSGKSTALKVLTGIYRPTSGRVAVNGSVSALLEVGAGFHPELTGRENIRLNATILGFTNREIDRLMDQIIDFADIGEHIDGPIKHYSSGMYVRLGFAVAVMVRPEILLVDEVIAVGDEEFQRKCFDYLFDLRRTGTSMVVVSHGLSQITDLCDEAVWLAGGIVQSRGNSHDVVNAYLASVNAMEDDGLKRAGRDVGGSLTSRRDAGPLRIDDIRLEAHGNPDTDVVTQGSDLQLRLSYSSDVTLGAVAFEVQAKRRDGAVAMAVHTQELGPLVIAPGSGTVDFQASPLLLTPGPYTLATVVRASGHVLDDVPDAMHFQVRPTSTVSHGTYVQPGRWSDPQRSFTLGGIDSRRVVFVAGCPHSGTTLLATILGCAPGATLIPRETGWFTRALTESEIRAELADVPGIPIEKTPSHVFHMASIAAAFPNSTRVVIVRDPRDTVASLHVRYSDFHRALDEYRRYSRSLSRIAEDELAEMVRLEDILDDLPGVIGALCPLLGLEYVPQMEHFYRQAPHWFAVTDPEQVPDSDGPAHTRLRAWQVRQPLFDHRGSWKHILDPDQEAAVLETVPADQANLTAEPVRAAVEVARWSR